jgi:hypothetical protein
MHHIPINLIRYFSPGTHSSEKRATRRGTAAAG